MWEVIGAVSGAISAICDIRGTTQSAGTPDASFANKSGKRPTPRRLRSFLLRCAGWWLTVFSFILIGQPYGSYINDREYRELLGWIIAGPAFLIIVAALDSSVSQGRRSTPGNHRTRTRM
jgi:hypothetical protein